jgi:hypothetical protein
MSQIIFNSYIDMVTEGATPSTQGYTVAYDIDGVLKQKDENGVVTPISADYANTIERILRNGNLTGTYSIQMGTASYIYSRNGTGRIALDQGSTSSVYISVTGSNLRNSISTSFDGNIMSVSNSTKRSSLVVSANTFSAYVGTTTYSTFIENLGDKIQIGHYDVNVGSGGKINVIESGKTYNGVGSLNMAYLHLNAYGASTSYGVINSVVIGGQSLTASKSNYVYLGNWVNVNNAYTLPNTDGLAGYILTTNGGGTLSWTSSSSGPKPLSSVLADGNYTGPYSIIMDTNQSLMMGTGSTISSTNGGSIIRLDYGIDSKILLSGNGLTSSAILIGTVSQDVSTRDYNMYLGTGSITTNNLKGLMYTADYSSTFTSYSLVTKGYVDNNAGGYQTHLIAYVDVNNGSDSTGEINKPYKPYLTIAAAMIGITASTYNSTNRGLIHIRKGNYTDVARLIDNVDYFCEQGVVFTQNGFSDISAVTANVYGNASFIGTNSGLIPLTIAFGSTVKFEFDTVDNRTSFGRIYGANANVTISGKEIKTLSSVGYGLSIEGSANVRVNVLRHILAAYYTIRFSDDYSGTSYIRTPYIYSDGGIGLSGYVNVRALTIGSAATGMVTVDANVEDISTVFGGSYQSAIYAGSGTLIINGNVKSTKSLGLYTTGSAIGRVTVTGDIVASREAIYNGHVGMQVKVRNSMISTDGLGGNTQSIYIESNNYTYIENSTIYNGLTDSYIIKTDDWDSTIGLYNVSAYSPGELGSFITTSFIDYTIGLHNVRSNKDNEDNVTDLFDPSGFIYDPYFFVPKF